jgi:hypothetical protein
MLRLWRRAVLTGITGYVQMPPAGRENTGMLTPGSTPEATAICARSATLIRLLTEMPRDRANATTEARSARGRRHARG